MEKLINDTFKTDKGKWSRKSLQMFFSFWVAVVYEFSAMIWEFETKEYFTISLLTFSFGVVGMTVYKAVKKFKNES